jgi:aminoglycoside 3-N-acetyltransferase
VNTDRAAIPAAPGPTTTRRDVVLGLRRLGVAPGDTVFFHSSLKSMGRVEGGAETVLDGFLEAVGESNCLGCQAPAG